MVLESHLARGPWWPANPRVVGGFEAFTVRGDTAWGSLLLWAMPCMVEKNEPGWSVPALALPVLCKGQFHVGRLPCWFHLQELKGNKSHWLFAVLPFTTCLFC